MKLENYIILLALSGTLSLGASNVHPPKRIRKAIKAVSRYTQRTLPDIDHEWQLRLYLNRISQCVVQDRLARSRIRRQRQKYLKKYAYKVSNRTTAGRIERLIAKLSVPDRQERDVASEMLYAVGKRALPMTRQAFRDAGDPDTRRRLKTLVTTFDGTLTTHVMIRCLNAAIQEFYVPYLKRGFPGQPIEGCRPKEGEW